MRLRHSPRQDGVRCVLCRTLSNAIAMSVVSRPPPTLPPMRPAQNARPHPSNAVSAVVGLSHARRGASTQSIGHIFAFDVNRGVRSRPPFFWGKENGRAFLFSPPPAGCSWGLRATAPFFSAAMAALLFFFKSVRRTNKEREKVCAPFFDRKKGNIIVSFRRVVPWMPRRWPRLRRLDAP